MAFTCAPAVLEHVAMRRVLAACGGFLAAVLWFDLMFDVQVLAYPVTDPLPEPVLASIAGYYGRVTTAAYPMNLLVGAVMLVTMLGSVVVAARERSRRSAAALLLAAAPIGLAVARVLPDAVRLGTRADSPAVQSALARTICHDHLACLAAIAVFVALQVRGRDR